MEEQLGFAFQDAHNFLVKLNLKLKEKDPDNIPEEYKDLVLKQVEILIDHIA